MTHFNLNRMLQGCSAFIQMMAGDRAARNGAKRVNNHVLPLTCPLLASSLRLTCPLQLRRIALILCVLAMSVGQMWGEVYKTYSLSDLTNTSLTYEKTGLSDNDQKLNKGERKVEVPCASASGTLYLSGTGAKADRYASIWGSNGTAVDATRKIAMTEGYGSGISFTSADILTEGGKYYIIFSNVDGADYKINAFKYTLSAACGGGGCTAPSSVSVDATNTNGWRYSLGETIDLTCTAEGGTGTKTYQWQKYIGSTWTDINTATNASAGTARLQIANCTSSDGGSYRCVVSTGATCSLASDGYWVRVFTLNGAYYGGSDTENAIVWTDANTGVATVHLNASSTYMFKVTDNDGRWFGNGENNYIIQPVALDCGTDNQKLRLLTGPEGDYTFTINVQHAADVSPYVNIATGYPTVSHPNSGYAYITKWWDCYIHYWEGTNNDLTAWGSDPKINSDRYVNICGTDYWYFPVIDTYNKFIAKNNAGNETDNNTTGNQETTGHGGKYITHDGSSWGWHEFTTYTISFANGGGTGTMSAMANLCPGDDPVLPANTFTRTGYTFNGWKTNVAITANSAAVAADGAVAAGATINDIATDITLTAQWTPKEYTITLGRGSAPSGDGGEDGSAKVLYNGTGLTNISHAVYPGHVLTGYYDSNKGGNKIFNADGSFAGSTVKDLIADGKWVKAENTSVKAQWNCIDFTPGRGGTADGTYTVGEDGGTLTCSVAEAGSYTYQWKQYTSGQDAGDAVNAVGTGATSTSFTPHPTVAGTYYYFCEVTNSCDVKKTTSTSGTFVFNAAATYDIIYAANLAGAEGSTASTTGKSAGYTESAKTCGYSKSGYKFKWWNTAADGSGEDFYVGETVTLGTGNLTLYAQWEQVSEGWAYWVGDNASSSPTDVAGNAVTMRLTKSTVDYNTDLTKDATTVSKHSSTNKHAKVLAIAANDNYLQVHFTDDSPINALKLGVAAKDDGDYAMAVIYSTTADFSSGTGEIVTHNTPRHSQTTKSVTDFSPTTTNKYKYARIYRNVETEVYGLTGGSAHTIRIYSIKAQKGTVASTYTGLSVTKDPSAGSASAPTISATSVAVGSGVTVTAGAAASGYVFTGWTSANGTFADASALSTTFTPNANNAVATAHYTATKTITIKFQHNGNTTGWTIQGKTTYPADQTATITVDGDWVVMTFSNVYAVSNIDLAGTVGDWDYLNTSTKITDDACYDWTGTAISCAELTAIEANTLYQAADMANITFTSSDQWFAGLSTNSKFKVYGNGTSTSAFGKNENHSVTDDIDTKNFTSALYITTANNTTSTSDPTQGAIEFITPSTAGTLYLYLNTDKSGLSIKEKGANTSTSLSGAAYKKIDVEANTHYFINGAGDKRGLYGIKFIPAATYTVTYNGSSADDGGVPVDASSPYTSGSTVTVLGNTGSLTRSIEGDAATFYGWNTNSNMYDGTHYNEGKTFSITANTTLYAVWGYTITWNLNSGEWVDYTAPTYYIYGQGLTLPAAAKISKSGYTFDHWELAYDNSTITAIADDATGNVTLNAIWTAAASSYSVTYNGNDNTGGSVPTDATSYSAGDFVTVKGNTGSLVKSGQTFLGWSTSATASSGTFYPAGYKFEMPASNVTLYAVWGSAAEEKYYYGSITITTGALTPGSTGGHKGFFTNSGGVIASSDAISLSSTPGEAGYYYESSTLTHTALNKSSNWNASSSSKRTIRAFKFKSGDSYTLALGSKVATSIMFYGKCGSKSKTMTVGDQEYESPSTADKFFSHEFTKSGNFTGNVSITQDGDFYGILVITISTGAASNFTVSFNMNGHGSAIDAIANVPSGSKIGKPIPDPAAVDWEFGGWHNEAGCTSAFDFANTTITADKTLYAKWTNCAPTITTQPVEASYTQNATATALTVAANNNGGGELHYQWWMKENDLPEETGSAIPGETGTSFTPSTELLGTNYYYCVVSNDCGNVFSSTAGITITDTHPNPKAVWNVAVPTHGGKGFSFSVEVNKNDDSNWDGTLTADMLTLSSEAVLDESSIVVDNTNKTIRGTYGVKGSATSPVTFYLLLPATTSQAAARLDYDRTFTACVGGSGDSYDIRVRKTTTKDGNYYHWANTDGWISQKIASSFSSEKASTKMGESEQFDSIYNTNGQYVWVRTYHANINKVRIYADFRANDMTVSNVYKHTDYFSEASKYIVGYTAVYNGDAGAANLGDAAQGYVDITLEEPMNANDIVLVKFNDAKVRTLGAVLTEGRSGGSLETSLVWSNNQDNGATLVKREDDVDFTITANRGGTYSDNANASLGTISYSSNNTSVATVNAATGQVTIADNIDFGSDEFKTTTITATLAASGCYKRCVLTYVLQVNKYVCTEAVGTVSIQTDNGCSGKVLEVSGYKAGADIQWYKDGEVIPSATSVTYNATEGGTYYVVTTKTCDAVSNEITITFGTATATKIVDEWYVKNGRRTPDIALVQTENATSFTVTSGGSPIDNIGGCKFYLGTDGIIYLKGQRDDGSEPNGLTAGVETITITASACVAASGLDIVIHKQEQRGDGKPEIAFVVDGTLRKDGGTATSVLAEKTSSRPIWEFLSTYYALTGCNAYWSVNSKELRQYYSQFDAILITDDPNTSTKGTGGVSYVKAFGTMVDVRPVLTMEAYVGKFEDGGWHVYNATPSSPNPRQVEMKLECKNHDIFAGLNPSTMDNVRTETINDDEYWFVTMVDTTQSPYHNTKDDHEALPALQGFDKTKFSNMLGVGTIKNDELQAGVERQEEPAARMMILGIQNNAMAALTTEGKMVVKNALDYLLKTDMEDVNDCANYFLGTTNNQWNVASNWSRKEVPDFETRARILRPVVVPNDFSTRVARVDIASDGPSKKLSGAECTGSLTISPLGALVVSGKVSRVHAPYYGVNNLMPTRVSDVAILSGTAGNGTLIMDDASGENKAYVQMYSKAVKSENTTWQYIGIPHSDVGNAMDNYYDSWLYSWSPSAGWEVVPRGAAVTPWTGYCITYPTFGHIYEMEGTLVATADVDIDVPASSYQIIGNSWVAPIQIANFEDEDFGDIPKTVYFFNTGSDTGGSGTVYGNATGETRWAPGTYVAVPIHMAEYTGEDKIIPSMQGFYVGNTGSAGTLHLDYDKLVRQRGVSNYIQGQMHAPRRIAKGSNDPVMLKMIVRGSRYDDRLIVAEREDFTKGHDDGWDGAKWDGSTISPTIWSQNEEGGVESVTATPDMEGTIIGFRAGEDNEYTFHFEYDDMAEPLFLLDMDERMYVRILNDVTYTFTCADKGEHNRFLLTRKAPGIPTGCEPIDGGGGPKAMKFIKDNKLYILLNGVLYDATGKVVE